EDGIRDFHVTGVQTCALPISVAGSATVTEETPVTMECGIQEDGSFIPLITWMDLESCIEHATERERTDYIAAANDREDVDLTWKIGRASCRERGERCVVSHGG